MFRQTSSAQNVGDNVDLCTIEGKKSRLTSCNMTLDEYIAAGMLRRKRMVKENGEIIGYDIPVFYIKTLYDIKPYPGIDKFDSELDKIENGILKLPRQAAARVYSLSPMCYDSLITEYLLQHDRLRCFDLLYFINTGPIKYNGDLLVRLLWADPHILKEPRLGSLCLRFTHDTRISLARFMLQAVGLVSTTFSMLPQTGNITHFEIKRLLQVYVAESWNTADMDDQSLGTNSDICDGFNLVSETLKILMDDFARDGAEQRREAGEPVNTQLGIIRVEEMYDIGAMIIIEEMFAYLYCRMHQKPDVEDFVESTLPLANNIYHRFTDRSSILRREEYENFLEERLTAVVTRISNGEPVMGEVRFAARHLQPYVNINSAFPRERVHYTNTSFTRRARYFRADDVPPPELYVVFTTFIDDFPITFQEPSYSTTPTSRTTKNKTTTAKTAKPASQPGKSTTQTGKSTTQAAKSSIQAAPARQEATPARQEATPSSSTTKKRSYDQAANQQKNIAPTPVAVQVWDEQPPPAPMYDRNEIHANRAIEVPIYDNQGEAEVQQWAHRMNRNGGQSSNLPSWLSTSQFSQESTYNDVRRPRERNIEVRPENYQHDTVDSDHEYDRFDDRDRARDIQYPVIDMGPVQENFYKEICEWIVHPSSTSHPGHIYTSPSDNSAWIRNFFRKQGANILKQVAFARDAEQYMRHLEAFLILSVRADVRSAFASVQELRDFNRNASGFVRRAYNRDPYFNFTSIRISHVAASQHLFHLNADSNDMAFNEELLEELMGLTLCIAYLERNSNTSPCPIPRGSSRTSAQHSNIFFMLVRSAYLEGRRMDTYEDSEVHLVRLRLSVSKTVLRDQNFIPEENQVMYFKPLMKLGSNLRSLKAIQLIPNFPESFRSVLYGQRRIDVDYNPRQVLTPVTRSTTTQDMVRRPLPRTNEQVQQMITRECDHGSLQYIRRCFHHRDCKLDQYHFNALIQVLRTIGDAAPNTSGICLLQGPPGTGKTNLIVHLIGALIHHSVYGHLRPEDRPINVRGLQDNILRAARNPNALRILVVASSNAAVDNILERLHAEGVPNPRGEWHRPTILRISRYDYVPADHLLQYTIYHAAREYDRDHANRNNPTLRARRQRASENIIFLSTSSSAGSSSLKELRQWYDVVIHDEAANAAEIETMIPLAATTTRDGPGRMYYIGVGDERQLPSTSYVPTMIDQANMRSLTPFEPETLIKSLFERLVYQGRACHAFLPAQYRMHPSISRVTSVPFYKYYFVNPIRAEFFNLNYNQPHLYQEAFYPMTFIDTSSLPNRFEQDDRHGQITNETEAMVIVSVLNRLFNQIDEGLLDREIAIIAPYRAQVNVIRRFINLGCPELNYPAARARRGVLVSTVDSIQGSQRNVVIFSTTRSNMHNRVGFVREPQRLNVSVTRARYLNVIIGDFKTIDTTGTTRGLGISYLKQIYDSCSMQREPGARLAKPVRISRGPIDEFDIVYQDVRSRVATRSSSTGQEDEPEVLQFTPSFDFSSLYPNPNQQSQT